MTWAFDQPLPPGEKLLLLALADHADEKWSCFPGQESLATKTTSSVSTVRRTLVKLEDRGLISRERRQSDAGYRKTDRFILAPNDLGRGLPVNLSGGQNGLNLPVKSDEPTGQNEGAYRSNDDAYRSTVTGTGNRKKESPVEPSVKEPMLDDSWIDEWFELVWKSWPKKADRKLSDEKFRKVLREKFKGTEEQLLTTILAHAKAYIDTETPVQFVPGLAVWLNKERWLDEPVRVEAEKKTTNTERTYDGISAWLGSQPQQKEISR